MAEAARELVLEEAKEQIVLRARERGGFVHSDELLVDIPVDDFTPEQIEEFLTHIEEHLRHEGIEIFEQIGRAHV